MVRAVGAERGALTAPQFDAACERITELLCLLVTGQEHPPAPGHLAEVEAVVRRYVREHATDPGLTGAAMAQDLGWSLRQIQLALQRAGTTPRALIREERLRLVRDRLRNPRDRHVTITDIAHATGFSSASALSHAFRRRFGVSPRELRSR
ncbi:helix-turn-helix transcriptional regulator [Actinomadura madurae]|nr:helix-turn-helix transcriptional regulator [Actinomadura madurae]MCQ0005151.1 helix-turn-helix transcriptional regulator [Actinomadura madurae]